MTPPVYLAEAHLSLLKLLFTDRSSDDWWWSILETDETEGIIQRKEQQAPSSTTSPTRNNRTTNSASAKRSDEDNSNNDDDDDTAAVIRFDLAAALGCPEDPLMTQSWLRALEQTTTKPKVAVKQALKVVSNKWVAAYLRKCLKVSNTDRAIHWLVQRYRQARPDLASSQPEDAIHQARAQAVEVATRHMEKLSSTAPAVSDEDVVSDWEEEDDDDDDDSDEEEEETNRTKDNTDKLSSALPPKPLPTLVDLLLPPEKPAATSEFCNPFTWSHLAGATAARVIHRMKRLLNECDDRLREASGKAPLTAPERREREAEACGRFLTECAIGIDIDQKIVKHLCAGGNYLDLSPVERLCLLRILVEAASNTVRVHEVVTGNFKQKVSAEKALELERRRSKREAKEKAAADELKARNRLASDAKVEFIEARKEEIRQLNSKSQEFSDDVIDSLTEEDIIEFDDDFKADFEALPAPESFSKQEVSQMISKLQEEEAFDTNLLEILTMEELLERERKKLTEMKEQLENIGGSGMHDDSWDRDTQRSIERLKRSIERAQLDQESLPHVRESALQQLQEALEDGTIKVLRTAYATAKKAGLVGTSEDNAVWALEEVRAVALELENAKQNKRVLDAQRDLVTKRNRCFIRTDPIGFDRQGNRFWSFSHEGVNQGDEAGEVWTQVEFFPEVNCGNEETFAGCVPLRREPCSIEFGVPEREEDFVIPNDGTLGPCFGRQEYHSSGFSTKRSVFFWGCHRTEASLRAVTKSLSANVDVEQSLKTKLKESLETEKVIEGSSEKDTASDFDSNKHDVVNLDADEEALARAKDMFGVSIDTSSSEMALTTAIGANVRVRKVIEERPEHSIARYENCKVDAWKMATTVGATTEKESGEEQEQQNGINVASWRAVGNMNNTFWLTGKELLESISRFVKWKNGQGYFEDDAAFFAFRNTLGRHCGKVADAPYAASPSYFAKLMIKREAELYPKLKLRSYDNNWGGQNGARAMWTNSMRDYAYDFQAVKQGLITLEDAFFQLTRGFTEYKSVDEAPVDVRAIFDDHQAVFDIELESMDKDLPGLWNSPTSRAIFLHVIENSTTTGFLALGFDLLCRNTMKYLQVHKLLDLSPVAAVAPTTRVTRRMNAWQQQQLGGW